MNWGWVVGSVISMVVLSVLFSQAAESSDTSIFEVDIEGPLPPVVSIEAPDYVDFGSLAVGEETDSVKIYINNTGNTDVVITPRLVDNNEEIFNYTYFQRRTTEAYKRIGNFSFSIAAPTTTGGVKSDYIYAKLDLRDFPYEVGEDILNHQTNVQFVAAAQ